MQDRIPLYPGRVKMTPVAGQANTYDMVRADDPTQAGTPLNKASLLKDATAALYGLTSSAVPDDIFAAIGKYKQYWWRRRVPKTTGYIEDLTSASGWLSKGSGSIYYTKSISISTDGTINFTQDGTISVSGTFPSTVLDPAINSLKAQLPCYIKTSAGGSFASSVILYLPENTSITKGDYSGDSDYGISMSGGYTVTSKYVSGEAGPWQYIQSSNRSTYPDNGTQDGYEYEYLGVPFDNAVTAPKIEVGSYVGTGTYGVNNPNTLTFGFVPKVWGIYAIDINKTGGLHGQKIFTAYGKNIGFYIDQSSTSYGAIVTYNGNSISWYASNVDGQLNNQYNEYYYFAIR